MNVGGWKDQQPPRKEDWSKASARKIQSTVPLYSKTAVLDVLKGGTASIALWTADCKKDVTRKLEWEAADVVNLLKLAMGKGKYKGSEWCESRPGGPVAACDSYVVSRLEHIQSANREMQIQYFVKFCIAQTGNILLVISCHV